MKHAFFISLVVAGLLTACGAGPADDAKAIEGNWRPVKGELGGQPMTDAVLQSIRLKLDNGKYEVLAGNQPDRGTYTLDSTSTPKSLTITGTEGPNRGKTFPAVFELSGDTLRICYDLSGAKRPTEFKSVAGTQLFLVTYIRNKE
ncbi:MAG TPA: TIGR03067 domain-containing protein [Candidatus Acidoferrum sp.]|nr:TIGR03067 domain-containing protein [Candidatus Acidoferrum sp.]